MKPNYQKQNTELIECQVDGYHIENPNITDKSKGRGFIKYSIESLHKLMNIIYRH